jgi:type IV pilus assembly protein PilM
MQKVLSIEIGVTTTKICEMDYRKKNPKIYRSILFNTPDNTVEDGYIRDKSAFAEFMRKKLEENGFRVKNVVFTISSNKILSREVVIPLVKDNRIAAVVESEANEYFPRDITDHIVTYTVLEKRIEEKKMLLLAFAAPANLVKNYYSFAELLDLSVVAIDYVGNSSYQWLKKTASTECDFVLQINEENSIVTIMNDGVLTLQRTINYGTNMLAEAVIETNAFDVDEMAAATELLQAEELLWPRFVMDIEEEAVGQNLGAAFLHIQQAKEVITDSMQLFISNLSRIIEYQVTRSHQMNIPLNIKEILITGGGAQVKGLGMLISNELAIPVRTKNEMMDVILNGDLHVSEKRLSEFLTCFGAAIAPVNFVPQDYVVTEQKRDFWKLYAVLFGATVLVSALLVIMARQNYQVALENKGDLEQSIQDMSYIENVYANYLSTQEAYNSLQAMEDSTYSFHNEFNQLLSELEEKLPSGSIVHTLSSDNISFTMSISTTSKEAATQFLLQLQEIPYIVEAQIAGLTESEDPETGLTEVTFSVTCFYTSPITEEVAQ